jgi:predicted esterase
MRSGRPLGRVLIAGVLGASLGGCSGSSHGEAGNPGGYTSSLAGTGAGSRAVGGGGSGAQAGSGSAGAGESTSGGAGAGGAGMAVTGGNPGNGGAAANGGSPAAGGTTAIGGSAANGGSPAAAGTPSFGGQTSGGGRAGRGSGGSSEIAGRSGVGGQTGGGRLIAFGTLLDPAAVISAAQALAESQAKPTSAQWQAKGDQHRTYHFADANTDEPYRLYVPTDWDGASKLPLMMFLHGSGSDENAYVDQNNKQMLNLAQQHGYVLVSPLGAQGAYGNFLRLTAPFGDEADADALMAAVTTESERTNELSEKDVVNVLELVLEEYPIDRAAMFLSGHSMGSGGTWYIGGKYASYWQALAPMSGPFVQETGYPWDTVRRLSIFVTEGTQTPSLDASRLLRDWLKANGFKAEYEEVNADHPGMVSLVLPDVFDFCDRSRAN